MKITTRTIGWLITIAIILFSIRNTFLLITAECIENCDSKWEYEKVYDIPQYVIDLCGIWILISVASLVLLIIWLFDSSPKTILEFQFSNPFKKMKIRKQLKSDLDELYLKMADADSFSELDLLRKKVEIIEDKLQL